MNSNEKKKIIARRCGYRRPISGTRVHICRLRCEPCERAMEDGKCPLINEKIKKEGDTDE